MSFVTFTLYLAAAGLVLGAVGILARINEIMRRPFKQDHSRPRGNTRRGILYAFTLGMAPWEKESTRQHWVAYVRGIVFHVGVFSAFGVLFASPWLFPGGQLAAVPAAVIGLLALVTGVGALAGFAGIWMRLAGENERVLSLPDDYFSVFLTSLFTGLATVSLLWPAALPLFYLTTAVMGVYIPFSKIRHCVYFFYSKFFFGASFGRRGVIGQPPSPYVD